MFSWPPFLRNWFPRFFRLPDQWEFSTDPNFSIVMQQKTHRPVQLDITDQTRTALWGWIHQVQLRNEVFLFPSRLLSSGHFSTGALSRLITHWTILPIAIGKPIAYIGIVPSCNWIEWGAFAPTTSPVAQPRTAFSIIFVLSARLHRPLFCGLMEAAIVDPVP